MTSVAQATDRPTTTTTYEQVPIKLLKQSPTNPRRELGDLTELTASIREKGVLHPIRVRPVKQRGQDAYEIVFGHRRSCAAAAAGLAEIPATVQDLSDREVLEIQLIENCQRSDLHPLDEADGYKTLIERHEYSAEDIAAKVAKSTGYVYQRLKLCSLVPAGRDAFLAGRLSTATALRIARIPNDKLQRRAVKEVTNGSEPMSPKRAAEHILRHFTLRLADAPFDKADPELVSGARPCTICPKRTGNQSELFDDVRSPDVCTDPPCFEAKREATVRLRIEAHKAAGRRVLSAKEAKAAFPYGDSYLDARRGFVDLDSPCGDDPKQRTWRQLVAATVEPDVVLVRAKARGPGDRDELRELVPQKVAREALKKKGHSFSKKRTRSTSKSSRSPADAKREQAAKVEHEARRRILAAVMATKTKANREDALAIVTCSRDAFDSAPPEDEQALLEILGVDPNSKNLRRANPGDIVSKHCQTMSLDEVMNVLLGIAVLGDLEVSQWSIARSPATELLAAAKRRGVDVARIRREVASEMKPKPAAKKTPQKGAKKAARSRSRLGK